MMSRIAERIYEKTKTLIKEKDETHHQIDNLKQAIDGTKKAIHRVEFKLLSGGVVDQFGGVPDLRFASELRELNKDKADLRSNEKALKDLTAKYNDLIKKVEDHQFWMHRADTTDLVRQQEAEKKIFG